MPSGAKKRKAAKKKKEKEGHHVNSDNNNSPHGNDDPRSQDERESEGDVSSPASRDHDIHQTPFNEGNEESRKRDPSSVQLFVSEKGFMKEVTGDAENTQKVGLDEGAVKIKSELRPKENIESIDVNIEHDRSSSSSSDEESQVIEKKPEKEAHGSASQTTSHSNLDKPVESFSEELTGNASLQEAFVDSVMETAPVVDSVKPVCEEVINVIESVPDETSVVCDAVKSRSEENEEKLMSKLDEVSGVSLDVDLASKGNADKVFSLSGANGRASSGLVETVVKQNEGKILPSSDAPVSETSNGLGSIKASEIPECSEKEPLPVSAPQVVQRASWLSCCGLFDLITGFSR